jgi:hypothetical protein
VNSDVGRIVGPFTRLFLLFAVLIGLGRTADTYFTDRSDRWERIEAPGKVEGVECWQHTHHSWLWGWVEGTVVCFPEEAA